MTNLDQYRASAKKAAENLWAELAKEEINWHTIELIGRELIVLAHNARQEQIRERQDYILSKYEEG